MWPSHNVLISSLPLKFIYSEKAAKFCGIFTLLLSYVVPVKSKLKISQNFVAFSEYMNFKVRTYLSTAVFREIDRSHLCLLQFDKFWVWGKCNYRKRKSSELDETFSKKFVKSHPHTHWDLDRQLKKRSHSLLKVSTKYGGGIPLDWDGASHSGFKFWKSAKNDIQKNCKIDGSY